MWGIIFQVPRGRKLVLELNDDLGRLVAYYMRDMGLDHGYCGEINTSVIAWYRSLGTLIPRSSWDGFRPLHAWCVSCCVRISVLCL